MTKCKRNWLWADLGIYTFSGGGNPVTDSLPMSDSVAGSAGQLAAMEQNKETAGATCEFNSKRYLLSVIPRSNSRAAPYFNHEGQGYMPPRKSASQPLISEDFRPH